MYFPSGRLASVGAFEFGCRVQQARTLDFKLDLRALDGARRVLRDRGALDRVLRRHASRRHDRARRCRRIRRLRRRQRGRSTGIVRRR